MCLVRRINHWPDRPWHVMCGLSDPVDPLCVEVYFKGHQTHAEALEVALRHVAQHDARTGELTLTVQALQDMW